VNVGAIMTQSVTVRGLGAARSGPTRVTAGSLLKALREASLAPAAP